MSNADLIERLRNAATFGTCLEAADALELADKRIAELEADLNEWKRCRDAVLRDLTSAQYKLAVAREELLRCKEIMLHECGIGLVNEVVLAQIGGDDASS